MTGPPAGPDVEQPIPRRIASVVDLFRDRPAVASRCGVWSYGELDRRAGRVAELLAGHSSPAGRPVAVLMTHDAPAVAALLGILEAGGLCLPLDPSAPRERLAAFLEDAAPAALLADRRHAEAAAGLASFLTGAPPVLDAESLPAGAPAVRGPGLAADPGAGAFLFQTSGSTGRPKGVVLSHRGVLHNVRNHTASLGLGPDDCLTLLSPLSAAAAVTATFGALANGACLCPFAVRDEGLAPLAAWMEREAITVYHSVPTLFRHVAESLAGSESLAALRVVKLGGERVLGRDVDLFRRRFPAGCVLVNGLGLTESSGNVCHFAVPPDFDVGAAVVPVGRPLPGVTVLLLEEAGRETAAGQVGEIAVRGRHLALGYWRDPERTAAAFVPQLDGETLYRTGDLGRFRDDGCLEHLGRKDRQVKVRGHRVDLAEVEAALRALPGVTEAAVAPWGSETLAACVVPAPGADLPPSGELRRLLAVRLPQPAVPSRLVRVPALPLLPNGKVDASAVARLAETGTPAPEAASDPLELQLREVWRRVFGRDVKVDDDFFELGGHSLTAARIAAGIRRALGVEVPLVALARAPTLRAFARLLRERGWTDAANPIVPLQQAGSRPPLFCVPGAGSDVFALLDLARHLGPDQPFYGLQPRGVDGSRQVHRSVEEMAAHFVRHLVAFRSEGSFRLAGTSFGGAVAFEMARQLQAAGREVELLILLDAHGPGYPRPLPVRGPRRLTRRGLRWCLPVGRKEEPSWENVRWGLREKVLRLRANLDMAWRRGVPPVELRFLYLQEVCFRARRLYRPAPYCGRVVLVRVEQQPPADLFAPDPALGWTVLATGGLEIHTVPGRHGHHIREPNVRILAETLAPYLRS